MYHTNHRHMETFCPSRESMCVSYSVSPFDVWGRVVVAQYVRKEPSTGSALLTYLLGYTLAPPINDRCLR